MKLNELDLIKSALNDSKVIAFPTETVMGLGVFFDDEKAYQLLNQIKRRPEDKPYTMMLGDKKDIDKYAYLSQRDKKIVETFMPGPVTLLLKSKDNVPNFVTHGTGIIGIRVPDNKSIREMISYVDKPLLVPSANRSGDKPLVNYQDVIKEFGDELAYVVKENAGNSKPSTIIDLTHEDVKILREGPISLRDIERIIK